ncbi:MAG TPA: S46 family peptidase [Caulobacteraceae bacterium]|jgi:hypothetical protein|nr:S46 family peptidase [Caulobacteraceae bacterium]
MRLLRVLAAMAAMLAACALAGAAMADEGMWTFDNFPSAAVKAKYGVTIDKAWLDHVQGSAVRLSTGCSASVVSAGGLVVTNNHCVADCSQSLSTPTQDYFKQGFTTAKREDERLCPGMQAEILLTISDVTGQVQTAAAGKTGRDFVLARDAEIGAIEKAACAGKETVQRCQVITLYQGGQYKLYVYRKYSDVRLVFAPEFAVAFFGGDPDNFNFPRYDLDMAFVRLYEGGAPAHMAQHLRWNPAPPEAGEPVFVAGNPGTTNRLFTADQLEALRDFALPETLYRLSQERGMQIRFGDESLERARISGDELFGLENSFKALHGQQQALADPAFIGAKRREDAELKAKVAADPKLAADVGDPWAEIARAQDARAALFQPYTMLERAGMDSDLFGYARTLVRAAAERTKPNGQRLPEYADARLPLLQKALLDPRPVHADLEQMKLQFWLAKLREVLTVDSPYTKAVLGKDSPESLSARLATSKLGDPAVRKVLWDGGDAAVQASDDPMIRFALAADPAARGVRKAYEGRVTGPTDRAQQRIAKARFAIYGQSVYPDATFSLRLSYGAIAGWTYHDETIPPVTRVGGLYERATGEPPFALPQRWLDAKSRLDLETVFDVSTTNDITGGNSGSPLINAKGEIIGAMFDGNIHSLGGAFAYDPALNRGVAVTTAAETEALQKVYGETALVKELTAR